MSLNIGDHYKTEMADGLVIYGRIVDPGEGDENADAVRRSYERQPHIRAVMAYSEETPQGEGGDMIVTAMCPITAEEFSAAKARGWR